MTKRRVLGVFAHPDDESFAAGLLCLCARAGATVTVVCATRGERGRFRQPDVFAGQRLADVRAQELSLACRALGAEPPMLLQLPDGELDREHIAARATEQIAGVVDRVAPDLVITLGADGAYGHRDHIACTRSVGAVVAERPGGLRVLHAAFPKRMFTRVWRNLRRLRPTPIAADISADSLGIEALDVDLCIDVGPVRDAKLRAIAAHRSQLLDGQPDTFLMPGLVARLVQTEWYTVAAGPPLPAAATDPFAGL